jgi:hypothetical protein
MRRPAPAARFYEAGGTGLRLRFNFLFRDSHLQRSDRFAYRRRTRHGIPDLTLDTERTGRLLYVRTTVLLRSDAEPRDNTRTTRNSTFEPPVVQTSL